MNLKISIYYIVQIQARKGALKKKKWKEMNERNILQLLGIPGRILVPPVTQFFRSKWNHLFLSVCVAAKNIGKFSLLFFVKTFFFRANE